VRIRSIRPEFWTSEDMARLSWDERLIYIGLWSYVDDNGVGRDVPKLIAADLFPLDDDTHGALMKVSTALKALAAGGQITRYEVDGKAFLHVRSWTKHQVINRPSKGRYPLPTCEDAITHDNNESPHGTLSEPSVSGEGEKGRRGEGEKVKTRPPARADAAFDQWWVTYPKKVGKAAARKAYAKALKTTDADTIIAGLKAQLPKLLASEDRFRPNPATWLNEGRWDDEPPAQPPAAVGWWQQ
jgi:hypothetical protein